MSTTSQDGLVIGSVNPTFTQAQLHQLREAGLTGGFGFFADMKQEPTTSARQTAWSLNAAFCKKMMRIAVVLLLGTLLTTFPDCVAANNKLQKEQGASVVMTYPRHSDKDVITFEFPMGVVDESVMPGYLKGLREQIYLHGSGVKLTPRSEANAADFLYPRGHAHVISYSFFSFYRVPPEVVPERVQNLLNFHRLTRPKPCSYEPNAYIVYGLTRRSINKSSCAKGVAFRDDVYFTAAADGRVETAIRCSPDDILEPRSEREFDGTPRLVPRCFHRFYLGELNAFVSVSYARFHLANWAQFERQIRENLQTYARR